MKSEKLIYILERDNWLNDINLNKKLINYLKKTNHKIVWEDPAGHLIYKFLIVESNVEMIPNFIKKNNLRLLKLIYGLFHWGYFKYLSDKKKLDIEIRVKQAKENLLKLGKDREIVILSRSAGGRYASIVADELEINHIICLSYPFKHPEKEDEPERYLHLETLKTPMLIFQCDQDEYGGIEVKEKYKLSPNIDLVFVKGTHDFNIDKQDWELVFTKMNEVLTQ